jgi:hypothetical protein
MKLTLFFPPFFSHWRVPIGFSRTWYWSIFLCCAIWSGLYSTYLELWNLTNQAEESAFQHYSSSTFQHCFYQLHFVMYARLVKLLGTLLLMKYCLLVNDAIPIYPSTSSRDMKYCFWWRIWTNHIHNVVHGLSCVYIWFSFVIEMIDYFNEILMMLLLD